MSKLKLIIVREFLAKVRNRAFVVMTFVSPLIFAGMVSLIIYLTSVNGEDKKLITVLDQSGLFLPELEKSQSISFLHFRKLSFTQAKDSSLQIGASGFLFIPDGMEIDRLNEEIQFYSSNSPSVSTLSNIEQRIERKLRELRLANYGISKEALSKIDTDFELNTSSFTGSQNLKGINEIKAFIGSAFGYLIMMFIIIYGSFVMRSVIEEKTSRIVEVIISSVKPFQLMMGKIIGTSLAGVFQFLIWIVLGGIVLIALTFWLGIDLQQLASTNAVANDSIEMMNANSGDLSKVNLYFNEILTIPWVGLLLLFIVYFVLGYLIYSSIYAAIGSAVDNETDTQQFIYPVIVPLILAVYVGGFSVFDNPDGPIAVSFSLFPLTSPIVMLMRFPLGGVPWWQIVVSILLLILTFIFIVWLAAKIYRTGILMHGKKISYKELYKWLKY
ncbi:ABC transporter permease [Spongiivirga citrea]|uniref:ABC transporter permease n=1 Tax=Spongiivirga citrea TaxID=1481457 RepID=A0A6M0CRS7_9FLAO|nr:ABC transporter permease [Spongiivirga citrea]NER18559.1 ABC transporter permease [Spongiivirga citrea]